MERIEIFREKFVFVFTTILITIGLICKERFESFWEAHSFDFHQEVFYLVVVALGALIAEIGAKPIVDIILKSKRIRKIVSGSNFIEGYWFYRHGKSKEDENRDSIFLSDALAEMMYNPVSKKLEMAVYRHRPEIHIFNSNSKTLKFDEKDKSYLNHFIYINRNVSLEHVNGFAVGHYTSDSESDGKIYRFTGTLYITGDDGKRMVILQEGNKIDEEVKKFKSTYKGPIAEWREAFLKMKLSLNDSLL
ncbi:MAG: hypothetical protein IPP71_02375 [Bacteroidetes bacterium]|nr:hypothetical protein [Bacteroidota bacterium]